MVEFACVCQRQRQIVVKPCKKRLCSLFCFCFKGGVCHIPKTKNPSAMSRGRVFPACGRCALEGVVLCELACVLCLFFAFVDECLTALASGPGHLHVRRFGGGDDGFYKTCLHFTLHFILLNLVPGICLLLIMKLTEHSGVFEARKKKNTSKIKKFTTN